MFSFLSIGVTEGRGGLLEIWKYFMLHFRAVIRAAHSLPQLSHHVMIDGNQGLELPRAPSLYLEPERQGAEGLS